MEQPPGLKWQGPSYDALGPHPLASRKRQLEEEVAGILKLEKLIVRTNVEDEPADDAKASDKIVRLHGLDYEAQTSSALWSDGDWCTQSLGDMLDSRAQKKMVLKHVRSVVAAKKARLGPMFSLSSSCALSTFRQLGKAVRNRMTPADFQGTWIPWLLDAFRGTVLPVFAGLELEIFVSGDRRVRKLRVCPTGATPGAHTRSSLKSAQ